jgi:hypothetical protein
MKEGSMHARRHVHWFPAPAAAALVIALASPAGAQVADGGTPGAWLLNYSGARSLGLGGAFVATADDALGALWNPAGLSFMDQNQLLFENVRLFEDTNINSFGFAVPGSWLPSFGVSMVSMSSGDFQRTNEMNDPLGTFKEGETAYLFTVAKGISPRLALGANVKLVQQTVENFSAGGVGVDAGAMLQLIPGLKVGLSALNLGGPSLTLRNTAETYPTQLRGGAAATVLGGRGLLTVQLDHASGPGLTFHGGTEYWIQSGLALRFGYDDRSGTGGFSYQFTPHYRLDYAVADHPLGMTHRVGLSYRFGGFFASSAADPAVFSPTGERAVTKIHLQARTKTRADRWTLDIVDKSDHLVRRFGGEGPPPAHLLWDGKDETGLPLADGVYHYQLVVKDGAGRVLNSTTHSVEISTGGPSGSVPLVPAP